MGACGDLPGDQGIALLVLSRQHPAGDVTTLIKDAVDRHHAVKTRVVDHVATRRRPATTLHKLGTFPTNRWKLLDPSNCAVHCRFVPIELLRSPQLQTVEQDFLEIQSGLERKRH